MGQAATRFWVKVVLEDSARVLCAVACGEGCLGDPAIDCAVGRVHGPDGLEQRKGPRVYGTHTDLARPR